MHAKMCTLTPMTAMTRHDAAVLVIEDDAAIRNLLALTFRRYSGIVCDQACDGAEGVRLLRERRYHVVLMDVMMPHLSGYEVLEKIREEKIARPDALFLFSASSEFDRTRLDPESVQLIVTKPFDVIALVELTTELVSQLRLAKDGSPTDVASERKGL